MLMTWNLCQNHTQQATPATDTSTNSNEEIFTVALDFVTVTVATDIGYH